MKCKKVINMQNAPCLKLSPQSTYGSNIVLLCFASFSLTTKRKKKTGKKLFAILFMHNPLKCIRFIGFGKLENLDHQSTQTSFSKPA